jgi:hypothetical protein
MTGGRSIGKRNGFILGGSFGVESGDAGTCTVRLDDDGGADGMLDGISF